VLDDLQRPDETVGGIFSIKRSARHKLCAELWLRHTFARITAGRWRERLSYEHRIGRSKKDDYDESASPSRSTIGTRHRLSSRTGIARVDGLGCCLTYSYAMNDCGQAASIEQLRKALQDKFGRQMKVRDASSKNSSPI